MTSQELEAKFTALTNEWLNTIGPQHHKDRDCHFSIERRWSYGEPPVWIAEHYGYWVTEHFKKECSTYRDAVQALIDMLTEELADAKRCIEEGGL